jgi:hypothetical protein
MMDNGSKYSASVITDGDCEALAKMLAEGAVSGRPIPRKRMKDAASTLWGALCAAPPPIATGAGAAGLNNSSGAAGSGATTTPTSPLNASQQQQQQAAAAAGLNPTFLHPTTGLAGRPRAVYFGTEVELGKTTLAENDRWRIQAAMRREEMKASGTSYNKGVARQVKASKPPTPGEGFPPGRGKPVR